MDAVFITGVWAGLRGLARDDKASTQRIATAGQIRKCCF